MTLIELHIAPSSAPSRLPRSLYEWPIEAMKTLDYVEEQFTCKLARIEHVMIGATDEPDVDVRAYLWTWETDNIRAISITDTYYGDVPPNWYLAGSLKNMLDNWWLRFPDRPLRSDIDPKFDSQIQERVGLGVYIGMSFNLKVKHERSSTMTKHLGLTFGRHSPHFPLVECCELDKPWIANPSVRHPFDEWRRSL